MKRDRDERGYIEIDISADAPPPSPPNRPMLVIHPNYLRDPRTIAALAACRARMADHGVEAGLIVWDEVGEAREIDWTEVLE